MFSNNMTTTTANFKYEENYPFIRVYKNLFTKIQLDFIQAALSNFKERKDGEEYIYSQWDEWFLFGKYAHAKHSELTNQKILVGDKLNEEIQIFRTLQDVTRVAMAHYIGDHKVPLPEKSFFTTPSLAYYHENVNTEPKLDLTMNFHTDYNTGEHFWPGDKFLLTTTVYPNDDYLGGEIIFLTDGKQIVYKPKAGDVIVFPSGDPLWPGKNPYFHAVKKTESGTKWLIRAYTKYTVDEVTEEWKNGVEKYGEEKWKEIARLEARGHNCLTANLNPDTNRFEFTASEVFKNLFGLESGLYIDGLVKYDWYTQRVID